MNSEGYILTIFAAIFLSWFVFRFISLLVFHKSHNKNRGIIPPATTVFNISTTSTTSTSSDLNGKYEVFLSFRGTDTRHGFTDFLYTYLVEAGIRTFRDDNELRIGEEIGPDLLKAIEDSKISIPIFSKNYCYSRWCLGELAKMVKCQADEGQKIFPIFYDVDACDVKNQSGSYEEAFRQHEKNFKEETVKEWREALKTVGGLKGYELEKETNRYEGELIKKLVKDVLLELKKNYAYIPDDLVGMDHHVQEMTRLLNVDSDSVRIVGVHGMGGIGKTTIAKAVYNKYCDSFDGGCFLEDVRERAKQHPNGLVDLQKQLIFQVLKKDFPDIVNVSDGIKKIKDAVHKKKVLIVLDDVDEKFQFDKVAGECNWFNKASRIIVTTRNKEVLDAIEATCDGKGLHEAYRSYEPELMTDGDSIKLFSKYAFMQDSPPKDYLILSQKVTSIAAGLPLVLITLGSLFLGIRNKDKWIAKLKKLEKVPNKDVMGKLRISFDALDDDDKKIFLDIACLFVGKDKTNPYYMWEDCEFVPEDGISTLVLRSLVKIGEDNKLGMHDHLRDLGRQIVREELFYKLSRVWQPEEALKVVEGGLGVENVEALILDLRALELDEYEQLTHGKHEYEQRMIEGKEYYVRRLKGQCFSRLQNLRFLRLGCVILDTDSRYQFSNLRWLEWRLYDKFIPVNLNMENLVILNLTNSTITDEWEGWSLFKAAKKLKFLNLSGCMGLIRGPNLSTIKDLECLHMKMCQSIVRLPDMSSLKMLKILLLQNCEMLHDIEGLGGLVSLELLDMKSCKSIERLSGLSNLTMLRRLNLRFCEKLHDIEGLEGLVSLEHLDMYRCKSVERLPGLSHLRMLRKLHLRSCEKLHDIEVLEGLVSLEYLDMYRCKSIERLPELSNLRMLRKLLLSFCIELREIEGLGGLVSLEHLDMSKCCSIERLPGLSNLRMLKELLLDGCYNLYDIEGLRGLVSLERLDMKSCKSIERLPQLSNLSVLKILDLTFCENLHDIEGIGGLVSLEHLDMTSCTSIARFPDLSNLKTLKTLTASVCRNLAEIRGLGCLISLERLSLRGCDYIERLPDLSNLGKLKLLSLASLHKLREIEGLSGLVSLETLDLKYCFSLNNSSLDLSCLKNLKKLNLEGIRNLTEVRGLEELKSLQVLDIRQCISLEKLPDLSNHKSLKSIYTYGCEKLREKK